MPLWSISFATNVKKVKMYPAEPHRPNKENRPQHALGAGIYVIERAWRNIARGAGRLRHLQDGLAPQDLAASPEGRPYDLAWVVLNHDEASRRHGWRPLRTAAAIFDEIAEHAQRHPDWLEQCGG